MTYSFKIQSDILIKVYTPGYRLSYQSIQIEILASSKLRYKGLLFAASEEVMAVSLTKGIKIGETLRCKDP